MGECRLEAMEHLKAAREEPEPLEGETFEEADKDEEEEPTWTTSPGDQSFKETLHGWTEVTSHFPWQMTMASSM